MYIKIVAEGHPDDSTDMSTSEEIVPKDPFILSTQALEDLTSETNPNYWDQIKDQVSNKLEQITVELATDVVIHAPKGHEATKMLGSLAMVVAK